MTNEGGTLKVLLLCEILVKYGTECPLLQLNTIVIHDLEIHQINA